ncbi:MAG TPA: uroporphyrinogen decarboxylase family protein, partial [Chloroflexota bacterium]|nr:uroporphyrinogen decarboxylase family protein [Chloroflexota bacterium]
MAQSAQWDRVTAAITGASVDRAPFGFWMHVPEIDPDPAKLARFTIDLTRRYDMDYVKVMFRSSWGLEDWGSSFDHYHPSRGYWLPAAYAIQAPEDWGRLQPLKPDHGALGEQLRLLSMVKEGMRGEAPVLATLFAPSMLAAQLAGEQTFVHHLREEPDAVHAGLKTISATLRDFAQACLGSGADGIFYAIQHASRRIFTDEEYQAIGRTYDKEVLESFHERSKLTMLHLHGDALMFDELATYPAHVLNWYDRGGGPSLREARQQTEVCLAGGIDHERTLMLGTPEEIASEVTGAVAQVEGRGVMIAPGCGVP